MVQVVDASPPYLRRRRRRVDRQPSFAPDVLEPQSSHHSFTVSQCLFCRQSDGVSCLAKTFSRSPSGNEDLVLLRVLFATMQQRIAFSASIKHFATCTQFNLRRHAAWDSQQDGPSPPFDTAVAPLKFISGAMEATRFWKSDRRLRLAWSPPHSTRRRTRRGYVER